MRNKNWRNPEMEKYFHSTDFYLDMKLNEKYHEVRYFDDFLDNIEKILEKHEDEIYFYTGWNYKPIKEYVGGVIKKYGICEKTDNEYVDYPIYINIRYMEDDSYTSIDRNTDKIVITINTYNLKMNTLRYSLQPEFMHVVCDYSEKGYSNLNTLKNTISYDDNIFDIDEDAYKEIMTALYWINKSEQEARLSATLKYVREKRIGSNDIEDMTPDIAPDYIIQTYFLNQLDLFKISLNKINREFTDKMLYVLGYYM